MKHTFNLASYSEQDLDALPFGIIHLDQNGTVIDYNAHEAQMSRLAKADVVGKNFFAHIAPCTTVPEFFGRFAAGLKSGKLNESFTFEFPFAHGQRQVGIKMLGDAETNTAWIFVADASQLLTLHLEDDHTITLLQVSGPPVSKLTDT